MKDNTKVRSVKAGASHAKEATGTETGGRPRRPKVEASFLKDLGELVVSAWESNLKPSGNSTLTPDVASPSSTTEERSPNEEQRGESFLERALNYQVIGLWDDDLPYVEKASGATSQSPKLGKSRRNSFVKNSLLAGVPADLNVSSKRSELLIGNESPQNCENNGLPSLTSEIGHPVAWEESSYEENRQSGLNFRMAGMMDTVFIASDGEKCRGDEFDSTLAHQKTVSTDSGKCVREAFQAPGFINLHEPYGVRRDVSLISDSSLSWSSMESGLISSAGQEVLLGSASQESRKRRKQRDHVSRFLSSFRRGKPTGSVN